MQLFVTAEESNTWEGEKEERVSGGAGGWCRGAVVCTPGENMLIDFEALFKTKASVVFASSRPDLEESGAIEADGSGFT